MRQAASKRYWAFRGAIGPIPVAWGTTFARSAAGVLSPVLMEPPQPMTVGPSLTVGEPPASVSTALTLADPEGEIASRLLPDRRGRQRLSGRVYVGEIVEGEALAVETPVSPTLHIAGNIDHQDGVTTVNLQSRDSDVLGASVAIWSVLEILSGDVQSITWTSTAIDNYLRGRPASVLLQELRSSIKQNKAARVPWIYEPAMVELTPLNDEFPRFWVAGIFSSSHLKSRVIGDFGGVLYPLPRGPDYREAPHEFTVKMEMVDALGNPRVVDVSLWIQPQQSDHEPDRHIRDVAIDAQLSAGSPPEVLRRIISDHSVLGADGYDIASFARTIAEAEPLYGGTCGGVFGRDGATIREAIQHIAPICGLRVWLGTDDKVHVALAGYSFEDAQKAKLELPELVEGDVFPRDKSGSPAWSAEIAGDPDDDSSGVARVSIDWSEDQRQIYPIETASSAPVLGDGPGDEDRERIISGAWVVPSRGADVAGGIQAGMSGDSARVELATHLGAHTLAAASLLRVSHPRGLGLPGLGWERRLARVDQLEIMPSQDSTRLHLTDLGLSERMRLGLLDTVEEWILFLGEPGLDLKIEDYGDAEHHIIHGVTGHYDDAPWDEGMVCIWTPGAEAEEYRRSWRVIASDGGALIVHGQGAPFLGAVPVVGELDDPVIGGGWAVMRTDLLDPLYREDFIRATDKETGQLESDRPGFQYSAY